VWGAGLAPWWAELMAVTGAESRRIGEWHAGHGQAPIENGSPAGDPPTRDETSAEQAPVAEPTPRPGADRGAYQGLFGSDPVAPGWMPWLGPISAATARRIACDCALTRIGIDANGGAAEPGAAAASSLPLSGGP